MIFNPRSYITRRFVSFASKMGEYSEIAGIKTTYKILKEGNGNAVTKGANVTVHATGVVKETGKKFWSTKDPGMKQNDTLKFQKSFEF